MKTRATLLVVPLLALACSKDASKRSDTGDLATAQVSVSAVTTATHAAVASAAPLADADAATPSSSRVQKSTVRLLDAGREPRRALRYAFRREQMERMAIELSTRISTDSGGARRDIALAPLEIGVALAPSRVDPSGGLSFAWHVESAALGALDAASPPEVQQGWREQLAPVEHLSGTATVSALGLCRDIMLDPGSAGDAGADAEMVVQVVQMLRDVAAPLPEEPVGTGARWQKISTLDAKSGHATQTDTYTLNDLAGDVGNLGDVLAQTASPQSLRAPGAGAQAGPTQMDQLLTSGTARVKFDLTRLVPQTSLEGTTSMALSAPSSRMNMVMHLEIVIRGTVP